MLVQWMVLVALLVLLTEKEAKNSNNYELIQVQMLFRHGDRTPQSLYPNDPNPESIWPGGLGALTRLGKQQLYVLGQQLRLMYDDFLTTNPLEIQVNSSESERCLESTQSFMASFYAPKGNFQLFKNFDWQPIPIHYIPKEMDKYLDTTSNCPVADVEIQRIIDSPAGQAYIAKHQEMFDYLTKYSGTPITDWISAYYLFDTLFVENKYNLIIPDWAYTYWAEHREVYDEAYYWWYNSRLMKRLRTGPLLDAIINAAKDKISGDSQGKKIHVYSAHDDNIALVLEVYKIFPMKLPPYASTLLFELYKGQNSSNFIRLLYLNSTVPEMENQTPHILKINGCEEFCPLQFFIDSAQPFIPSCWEEECGITS